MGIEPRTSRTRSQHFTTRLLSLDIYRQCYRVLLCVKSVVAREYLMLSTRFKHVPALFTVESKITRDSWLTDHCLPVLNCFCFVLYENIDQILLNKIYGLMHYKIGITCVYNGHVFYTML